MCCHRRLGYSERSRRSSYEEVLAAELAEMREAFETKLAAAREEAESLQVLHKAYSCNLCRESMLQLWANTSSPQREVNRLRSLSPVAAPSLAVSAFGTPSQRQRWGPAS